MGNQTVSGKIIRKTVKPGQWGNSIMFVVQTSAGEKMVSCFDNKLTEEAKSILQALVEGMYADFEVVENVNQKAGPNFGKTYLNIVSAVPVTQVRDDMVAPPTPKGYIGKAESVQVDSQVTPAGDNKVRSVSLSYVKDLIVAGKVDLMAWKATAEEFEQYILTGL